MVYNQLWLRKKVCMELTPMLKKVKKKLRGTRNASTNALRIRNIEDKVDNGYTI